MDESSKQAWIRSAVQQYEQPLMRYAIRRTGCVELAREVVQDTFLKLWQAERSSVDGHLAPWLYTVCRNRAADVRRKERRMRALEFEPGSRTDGNGESEIGNREPGAANREAKSNAETSEKHAALFGALNRLSDKQQEAVRLKFQSGLSYREIAEVMDITVNHVGVLLHNALKAIRETLTTSDDGEQPLISEQTR